MNKSKAVLIIGAAAAVYVAFIDEPTWVERIMEPIPIVGFLFKANEISTGLIIFAAAVWLSKRV